KDQNSKIVSYLVVVRDVTEQKRLLTIAEAVNNMNNIGFIFSGVRHELGNPVNSIKTATSILREGFDTMGDPAKREYLERIISDVQRLEALLKVLHSFSMFEDLSPGPVELCSFIRDLMPTVEPDFEKAGIRFHYQFPERACPVLADRRALYQIVVNLLTNAFNALRERKSPKITIRVSCGNQTQQLEVEDNGAGMSQEVLSNIFKPFYTTRAGGTGLGLVICQKLVLAMKGYIEVESAQGRGTKVSVTLPRAGCTEATEGKG
ncbi:MAG: two-component system sensor histidine kinase NtrB, partial [Desulfocucumaceae bacterium]